MPPGAPVRGSLPRARAARASGCARARAPAPAAPPARTHPGSSSPGPCLAPSPPLEVAPGLLPRGEGAVTGQMLGVFCADTRAWGACSWKDSGRTKPAGLVGALLGKRRSPIPPGVGAWLGERCLGLERVEKSPKQSDGDLMRWRTGANERKMLGIAALCACLRRLKKAQSQLCFLPVSLLPPKRVPFPLDVITQKG
ncbi:E3 ubiquitin-protein ligase RNF152 isoform X2 [Pongo abelii]|uniref:E3 ubiquitin-protein ligase RNF152 isoform X2 n=1 Tax=Pongo abelii TaxID=9601 RepID=UPI003006EFE2